MAEGGRWLNTHAALAFRGAGVIAFARDTHRVCIGAFPDTACILPDASTWAVHQMARALCLPTDEPQEVQTKQPELGVCDYAVAIVAARWCGRLVVCCVYALPVGRRAGGDELLVPGLPTPGPLLQNGTDMVGHDVGI